MSLNTNWQDFTSDIWQAGLFFEKVGLTCKFLKQKRFVRQN